MGYGQVLATGCVLTYYCTLIGLSIFYLGSSLYPTLPWTNCSSLLQIPKDKLCLPSKPILLALNKTRADYVLTEHQTIMTSAEQFFTYGVLKQRVDPDISSGLRSQRGHCTESVDLDLFRPGPTGDLTGPADFFTYIYCQQVCLSICK